MSEFFFCGIIEEPVVYASSSSTNWNSHDDHRMISSDRRDRCIISTASALHSSTQKSRSDTPSRLLAVTPSIPSDLATARRSVG